MTRKPQRRAFVESALKFYVFTSVRFWRRHVVMLQVGDQSPEPFVRFWSWDIADDFAEGLNRIVRNRERHLR